jgi:transposase
MGRSVPAPLVGGLFPPEDPERAALLEQIHQSPALFGAQQSRWTLALLRAGAPLLVGLGSLSGIWRRLQRWRIRRKRGRAHVTSPDPAYREKLAAVEQAANAARQQPGTTVLLYSDEVTVYRQPPVGAAYAAQGSGGEHQARANRSHASNTKLRVVGVLDAVLGRVLFTTGSKIGVRALCRFFKRVRQAYGEAVRLVWVWDNWPVHFHPEVGAAAAAYRIELLSLPTYAPWTNPIEKLWRQLHEELLSMHPYSDQWDALKQRVKAFLQSYDRSAPDLLFSVGLPLPN